MENLETDPQGSRDYSAILSDKLLEHSEERLQLVQNRMDSQISDYRLTSLCESEHSQDVYSNMTSIFEFKTLGLLEDILNTDLGEQKELGMITIHKLDAGFISMRLNGGFSYTDMSENVQTAFLSSKVVKCFQNSLRGVKTEEQGVENEFRLIENLFETGLLLHKLGVADQRTKTPKSSAEEDIRKVVWEKMENRLLQGAKFTDDGKIERIEMDLYVNGSMKMIFTPVEGVVDRKDLDKALLNISFVTDAVALTYEEASYNSSCFTEHFIHRPTGREFIRVLDTLGLKFNPYFESFLLNSKNDSFSNRYGGPYTQLSRNLAKMVYSNNLEKLNDVFQKKGGEDLDTEDIKRLANIVSEEKGFQIYQSVLKQLVERKPEETIDGMPAIAGEISIQAGACFDTFEYYLQAQSLEKLTLVRLYDQDFVTKTHGANTLVNLEPVVFRGVTLPSGCLFSKHEGGKLAFLRFTPFVYQDVSTAISAFGTEILKAGRDSRDLAFLWGKIMNQQVRI